jgi:hypothetical protein
MSVRIIEITPAYLAYIREATITPQGYMTSRNRLAPGCRHLAMGT